MSAEPKDCEKCKTQVDFPLMSTFRNFWNPGWVMLLSLGGASILSSCDGLTPPDVSMGDESDTNGDGDASGAADMGGTNGDGDSSGAADTGGTNGDGDSSGAADMGGANGDGGECSSNRHCDTSEFCEDGTCRDDVCEPDAEICEGPAVRRCKSDGSAYVLDQSCNNNERCLVDGNTADCVSLNCNYGELFCEGASIRRCDASGLGSSLEESCDLGEVCEESGSGLRCAAREQFCTPGEIKCAAGVAFTCADTGLSEDPEICDNNEYCKGGTGCVDQVCSPSIPGCLGNSVITCNSEGSGFVGDGIDCGKRTCSGGACTPNYLLFEDFEDGDYDGWQTGAGSYSRTVTSSQAANRTSQSLSLTNVGESDHFDGLNYDLGYLAQPLYVSFWARPTVADDTAATTYFMLHQNSPDEYYGGSPGKVLQLIFIRDNRILITAGGNVEIAQYQADQWYHIELEFDWSTKTIATMVNGVPGPDAPFGDTSSTGVRYLGLYHYSLDYAGYWDEIEIW